MGLLRPSHTQVGALYSLAPVQPSTKSHPFPSIVAYFFPLTASNRPDFCRGFLKAPLSMSKSKLFGLAARSLTIWACLALPSHYLPLCPHTPSVLAGPCIAPTPPSPVVSEPQLVLGSCKGLGITDAAQAPQAMPSAHGVPTTAYPPCRPTNRAWPYHQLHFALEVSEAKAKKLVNWSSD